MVAESFFLYDFVLTTALMAQNIKKGSRLVF